MKEKNKYHLQLVLALIMALPFMTARADEIADSAMDKLWGERLELDAGERGSWFKQAKYAMFIHWGLYSELAGDWKGKTYFGIGEWIMNKYLAGISVDDYRALAKDFNPVKFDAKAWVSLAKQSGMKYIVITAKHHDGFAMYGSKASSYNIVDASPFKRDPLKELADECRKQGLGFGFYYSQYQDWNEKDAYGNAWDFNPKDAQFDKYFKEKCEPQVRELVTQYGDLAVLWFDTPGKMTKEHSMALVNLVREHQPRCLINSRIGNGVGDYSSLGDMEIPPENVGGLWECVDTTNNSWSYAWYDQNWKSTKQIAKNVISVVARGGTYMLNIGPRSDGSIPVNAQESLLGAGKWIKSHAATIYGAQASPWEKAFSWGDVTVKGNKLYLHVFKWPSSGKIYLPGLSNSISEASIIGLSSQVTIAKEGDWTVVNIPKIQPNDMIPVIQLNLKGELKVDHGLAFDGETPASLLSVFSKTKNCEVKQLRWMEKFGEWKHAEMVNGWSESSEVTWEVNLRKPGKYALEMTYSCDDKADFSEFEILTGLQAMTIQALDTGDRTPSKRMFGRGLLPRVRTLRLGVVEFDKAGKQKVIFKTKKGTFEGFNLKALELKKYQ